LVGGGAIPVAWKMLPGNEPGAWKPHWQDLLSIVSAAIPTDWFVVVTADHGLYRSESTLVLIYNQNDKGYKEIARILQNPEVPPVFFLEGGFNAYKQFVAQQIQITQGQHQELRTTCQPCRH
jgi:hypothetical protein